MNHEEDTPNITTYEDIFNINCAEYMGYEMMFLNLGRGAELCYAPTRDGWDNPEEYNPWDNNEQLMEVLEKLVASGHLDNIAAIPVMKSKGVENGLRLMVADVLVDDDDRREQPEMSMFFDCQYKNFSEDGGYFVFNGDKDKGCPNTNWWEAIKSHAKTMPAEEVKDVEKVGDPSNIYWQAVNILRQAKHHGFTDFYFDGCRYILEDEGRTRTEELYLFMGSSNGLLQLMAIENYIRSCDNNFNGLYEGILEEHPYSEWLRDEELTTLESIHEHRKFVVRKCLEKLAEPYESEEVRFNKLCEKIRVAGEYPGCGIDLSTHRPYSDILQLAKIVEKVVTISGVPFELNTAMSGDMQEAMRNYVMINYNKKDFLPLEEYS